ncbi:MAG: glucose-6-phosphate dehydrogenase assembly protein OpcA [Pseudomonadota bacterium]
MSEGVRTQLQSYPPHKVSVARIQDELDGLWESLYQNLSDGKAVTRACMSNLIIYCDDDEQSREIEQAIPAIVQVHPARVIVLTGLGKTGEPGIEVFVSGHYATLASGWQVCAEQIRVVADADSSRRLPSVTRAHLVGDLPTTLWWASQQPPPFAGKLFFKLATMSDQIIYDSIGWTSPVQGMKAMSRWVAAERSEHIIFNLAWRRLKPWRRLLSQVLDPAVQPGALESVSMVTIEHGPHALANALLLLGWLATRLGWQPISGKVLPTKKTIWQFNAAGHQFPVTVTRLEQGEPAPHKVHWCWRDTTGEHNAVFALLGDQRLGIVEDSSDVPVRVISAHELTRSALVSAQLAHRTRDKLFESALEIVNSMTSMLDA